MAALEAARPGCARFVGGCVRNTLMGRGVDDIDIATQLEPEAVIAALEAADLRAIPTGVEHGTVTAVANGRPFEITSLRRDVATDGRRAVVAFTENWAEDARRRDFTMNAIYSDTSGGLFDETGRGVEDAEAGRVIFIGDPDQRLKEDFLRILRFFRFNAWYGNDIDAEGLSACERQRDGLAQISAERIWKEFKKLLAAPSPHHALAAMQDVGVLKAVLPAARCGLLPALERVEKDLALEADPMLRLMALLPRRSSDAGNAAEVMRMSNAERDRLLAWADPARPDVAKATEHGLSEALYKFGRTAVTDRLLIQAASGDVGDTADRLSQCSGWIAPKFPVGGDDIQSRGLSGPEVGETLRRLEQKWIDSGFKLDKDALLNEV